MRLGDFVTRADQLVAMADQVLSTKRASDYGTYVDSGAFAGFRAACLSFLKNLFGSDHPYYTDFDGIVKSADPYDTSAGRQIITAVRGELEGGWLQTAKGLVSAEIFADFLEMADYLLGEKYKDAAAVMIGSVLEEHLRQLCGRYNVPTTVMKDGKHKPKKADTMNNDLAAASAYNKLDQKNVTAWLDLRNKAAHGEYGEYTQAQVENMAQSVTEFMARNPV